MSLTLQPHSEGPPPRPALRGAVAESRFGALDALRAGAMFLGVCLHGAVSYMSGRMPGLLWVVTWCVPFAPTVIAFSPGFLAVPEPVGNPRVFISHGTADPVLPIDACSGAFVPHLRQAGYEVMFRPFDGGHTVPPEIADEAMRWWLAGPAERELTVGP